MNVLYVEDNPMDADLARRHLAHAAPWLNLEIAASVHEAMDRLQRPELYDLVLTDKRLPDGDGLDLLRYVREHKLPLAVVLITGMGDQETVVSALRMGADDYIVKLANYLDILPVALRNALEAYRRRGGEHPRPLRVLYAEHDPADIDLTRRNLANHAPHLRLDVVPSATDVLDRLAQSNGEDPYDVLLLDYRLPGMNALELLQELRATYPDLDTPVVLVTGQGSEEVALQALKMGVIDYLCKSDEYLSRLPMALENAFHRARLAREQAALRAANERLELRARQLRALAAQLSQAERQERRRLAQVLHDGLQQILAAARLQLGTVRRGLTDPARQHASDEIDEMLAQALKISRSLTFELAPPMLYELGLTAGLEWLARWVEQQHGLHVEMHASAEVRPVPEDLRGFLFQAARELLFNVAKHAGVSRAQMSIEPLADNRVRLVVSDQGRGFDAAQHLSAAPSGSFGLFSLQERLAALGGEMEVDSAPGRGTSVTLVVPLDVALTTPSAARTRSERIRLLVVDDRQVIRQGIISLLGEETDLEVVGEATNGAEALERARELQPDLVLMDINMPVLNGIEATRRLTAEMPQVRVIGLSVYEEASLEQTMRAAGAVDYVAKSSPPALLLAAVRACAARKVES